MTSESYVCNTQGHIDTVNVHLIGPHLPGLRILDTIRHETISYMGLVFGIRLTYVSRPRMIKTDLQKVISKS